MSEFNGKASYLPDYASYNWIGSPSDYTLSTNSDLGGDSRTWLQAQAFD
jgi:Amt family ammonium transporter